MSFSMSGGGWSYNRFDEFEKHLLGENCGEGKCGDGCECDKCKSKKDEKKPSKKGAKPDYLDMDKDGNKEESMKDAIKDAGEEVSEGYKSTPFEKMERQAYKHRKAEEEAVRKGDEEGANKHMKRRAAMSSPLAKRSELINQGKGPANEKTRKSKKIEEKMTGHGPALDTRYHYEMEDADVKSGDIPNRSAKGKKVKNTIKKSLKKEDLEATGLFSEEEISVILERLDDMPAGDVGHEIHKKAMDANQSAIDAANKRIEKMGIQYPKGEKKKTSVALRKEKEAAEKKKSVKESYADMYMEVYKGKHGQSDKEYQDGRSDAGKRISGDSKEGPASYSTRIHKNSEPTPPGEKPKNVPGLSKGEREELKIRKANLKKEELEATGAFSGEELEALQEKMSAMDIVRKQVEAKHGKGAIHDPKAPKKEVSPEEKKRRSAEEAKNREARKKEAGYDPMHSPRD